MGRLRYSINLTLDGCAHHEGILPDEELHQFWTAAIAQAGALLYGRTTYQMMGGWREVARTGVAPEGMPDWMVPFAYAIDPARKYVVSDTLDQVDWNAELIRGADLIQAVERLKQEEGGPISLGGIKLPLSLAALGLIDEYEFVIHPCIAGHGPTLLSGLPNPLDLKLLNRRDFKSGAFAVLYETKK